MHPDQNSLITNLIEIIWHCSPFQKYVTKIIDNRQQGMAIYKRTTLEWLMVTCLFACHLHDP